MTAESTALNRVERKRAQRVAELERAAARLFARRGYDRTNFEDVAAELDLRGPSLYHYFSSKEELLRRCLQSSSAEVLGRLRALVDPTRAPEEVLRTLLREQVLIEVRDFPEFAPLFLTMPVSVPDIRELVLEVRRTHAAIFEEAAQRVAERDGGRVEPGALRVRLSVAFGALAYIPEWYDPNGSVGPEGLADEMADTLLSLFTRPAP